MVWFHRRASSTRHRATHDEAAARRIIAAAAAHPLRGQAFWRTLDGLRTLDRQAVAGQAAALLSHPDARRATLGACAADVLLSGPPSGPGGSTYRWHRTAEESRQFTVLLLPLLRRACDRTMSPVLITSALGPYMMLNPDDVMFPMRLRKHDSPAVRARALYLVAVALADPRELDAATRAALGARRDPDRLQADEVLMFLDRDESPEVRARAADGARVLHTAAVDRRDRPEARYLLGRLARYLTDPCTEARVHALAVHLEEAAAWLPDGERRDPWETPPPAPEPLLDHLVRELADLRAHWGFVRLVGLTSTAQLRPRAEELARALQRLEDSAWPERTAVHDQWPDRETRAGLLAAAQDGLLAATHFS